MPRQLLVKDSTTNTYNVHPIPPYLPLYEIGDTVGFYDDNGNPVEGDIQFVEIKYGYIDPSTKETDLSIVYEVMVGDDLYTVDEEFITHSYK